MKKLFLSIALAVLLVIRVMPASVYADSFTPTNISYDLGSQTLSFTATDLTLSDYYACGFADSNAGYDWYINTSTDSDLKYFYSGNNLIGQGIAVANNDTVSCALTNGSLPFQSGSSAYIFLIGDNGTSHLMDTSSLYTFETGGGRGGEYNMVTVDPTTTAQIQSSIAGLGSAVTSQIVGLLPTIFGVLVVFVVIGTALAFFMRHSGVKK